MNVTLDAAQRAFARTVASRRFSQGGQQQYGAKAGFFLDLGAAEAELVVSIATGLPWTAAFVRGGADVGSDLEVRWTSHSSGRLIVHPNDPDGWCGVLVTGLHGSYRIAGWLEVGLAKRPRWLDVPRQGGRAYFVPQDWLRRDLEALGA